MSGGLSAALAMLAVVAQLTISSNFLTMVGIAYSTDGGNPLVKFHPGTYLAMLSLLLRLSETGLPMRTMEQLVARFPLVGLFLGMIASCIVWVIVNTGVSGVAAYVESYFSSGVLFLALADFSVEQRRRLGWIMVALFTANASLATGETVLRHNLLPLYLSEGKIYKDVAYEFRGLALYDHALTGGMMTSMGILLLIGMRVSLRAGVLLGLPLLVGLISFGGRTSLLVCVVTVLGIGGFFMIRGLLDRTLRPGVMLMAIAGVIAASVLLWFLVSETSVGVRLAGKLSFNDDSTATRSVQWLMPGLLNWNEFLFGISSSRELEYVYQLGLVYHFELVENFWLTAFMNLGAVGFMLYLTGLLAFLWNLWRQAPLLGRAIVVTTILVASTSNSLGHKSSVLFVMTAAVVATTGFARVGSTRLSHPHPLSPAGRAPVPTGSPEPADAFALRPPGAFASGGRYEVAGPTTEQPARTAPASFGGLLRHPNAPDRALRPLRLTTARS